MAVMAAAAQPTADALYRERADLAKALAADCAAGKMSPDKIDEEARELREAVGTLGPRSPEAEEELGDLLFAVANLARKLGVEPEAALRVANDKFQRRFDDVERQVTSKGERMRDLTLEQLEAHWQVAKANTSGGGNPSGLPDSPSSKARQV